MLTVLAALSLLIWLYLYLFHGCFWHADQRLNLNQVNLSDAPGVVAVIPARDEAESIKDTVRALLAQDYPGTLQIIVVDDNSIDGTKDAALAAVTGDTEGARVQVIDGAALAPGWVGKIWAVHQGIDAAGASTYLLLTDADIIHDSGNVSRLVAKAEAEDLGLVSLMVKLNCRGLWERLLIPAFVYFFQKLYPFPKVNDPNTKIAAAAGGCMLVHRATLDAAGGIERIKDRVIDDCAMAHLIKPLRPIWLGLSTRTESLRGYQNLASIWRMVVRTAFVQLRFSRALLLGTVIGMLLLYGVPVLAVLVGALLGDMTLLSLGGSAWAVMAWTFLPTLGLYRLSALWALTLPIAGVLYGMMTLDSARRHYFADGNAWKGRTYSS
tara:strand:- start:10764 stop:11906 length:1143 start_codon:yes stop_codon:yes gene_type:complete